MMRGLGALGEEEPFGGFGGGSADPYMLALARRQALAAALAKQGSQSAQQPMTSPWQVAGSIAQQGVGAWQSQRAEDEALNYAREQKIQEREMLANILRQVQGADQGAPRGGLLPPAQTEGGAAPTLTAPNPPNLGGGYADRVVNVESGGDPNARNPLSSATGAGQFIDSTWLSMMRKHKPEFAGKTDQELLALRSDPLLSRQMVQQYGEENAANLSAQGLPADDSTKYLAHWFGPGGAAKILQAPPATPLSQLMPPEVIRANPSLANQTAGGVIGLVQQKMGSQSGPAAPTPPPLVPQQASPQPAAQGMSRERRIAMAEALMLSGNPNLARIGAGQLQIAKALPENDRELVQVRQPDGSTRFVPRSQAAGMTSAPEPDREVVPVTQPDGSVKYVPRPQLAGQTGAPPVSPRPQTYPPEVQAQEIERRRAGAQNITVDQRGENSFATERGKQLAANVDEYQSARTKGAQLMTQFATFERANKLFSSGAGAGARIAVGKWAQQIGIPESALASAGLDKNALASAEEMRSLTSRMMIDMIGKDGFPAQGFSNDDRKELVRALANVDNTPEGNAKILAIGRAAAQRQLEIGEAWADWKKTHGNTPQSVERFQDERMPQITKRNIIASPGPVRVNTPEEAAKLPPGTQFIAPDGQVRVVPGGTQ